MMSLLMSNSLTLTALRPPQKKLPNHPGSYHFFRKIKVCQKRSSSKSLHFLRASPLFVLNKVRGSAAIALGYLSFDHTAEREMLRICRDEPCLVQVIKYYTRSYKLSPAFLEGWKHCVTVGLPGGL